MTRIGLGALLVLGLALPAEAKPRLGEESSAQNRDLLRVAQSAERQAASKQRSALHFDNVPAVEFDDKPTPRPRKHPGVLRNSVSFPTTPSAEIYHASEEAGGLGIRVNPDKPAGSLPLPPSNRPHY